jgi:hypothetical protein
MKSKKGLLLPLNEVLQQPPRRRWWPIFNQIRTILCFRKSLIINISLGTHDQKQRKSPIHEWHSPILRATRMNPLIAVDALNI